MYAVLAGVAVLSLLLARAGALEGLLSANYVPHQYCYLARPGLIWSNVVTDGLIALSYGAIFACLLWVALRLRDSASFQPYLWIILSFAVFIVACAATHVMEIVTIWWPMYPLAVGLKAVCALASVPTAVMFARATPHLAGGLEQFAHMLSTTQQERDQARAALLVADAVAAAHERAEAEIGAANEMLNHIMDSTHHGILKVDEDWTIVYANRQAYEMLPRTTVGIDLWTCFPDVVNDLPEPMFRAAMLDRVETSYERHYQELDQWFQVGVFPTPGGISIFFRNISIEKRLSQALDEERRLREKRIEALGHMAGGLAHEISNPLAIIQATASDLRGLANVVEMIPPGDVLAATDSIIRTSDRAIRILRGLRGFAREAGNDPMEPASLYEIVEQALDLQEARFARHGVDLRTMVAEDLPLLVCRETQIGQIVTNLLNNAYDAITQQQCPERWVELRVERVGEQIQVDVIDSGLEIDEATRARLMDPFFTTKTRGLGMGIGLSLSRAIALEHDGSLELCQGTEHTCFRLLLPLEPRDAAQPAGVAANATV
jgi:signal transduction histidine kinase